MSPTLALVLVGWGTLVGLDLVSVPQAMIARPIVAGPVAGALLGDLEAGLRLGVLFELFQYDILPVGAARYPEYGPATVAATAAAHLLPGAAGVGFGALVGLVTGMLGGVSLDVARRLTVRAVHRAAPAIEAGDPRAIARVHAGGIVRDAARAALVTALGLALALGARTVLAHALPVAGALALAAAAAAAALAAATAGTLRMVGRGPALRWLAAGLVGGTAAAWLQ